MNCLFCKKYGHIINDCKERIDLGIDLKICYKCGDKNHNVSDCPSFNNIDGFPYSSCYICK